MIQKFICGPFEENCYCISKNGFCVIIDPGMNCDSVVSYIEENKFKVDAILLTHGHLDHIDGIQKFGDVPIYIHELDLNCLTDDTLSCYIHFRGKKGYDFEKIKNQICILPKDELKIREDTFEIIHTPGHTKGSVVYIYNKEKAFTGDTLFHLGIGRTDLPGGSSKSMQSSIISLIDNLPDTVKIYPGHEVFSTIKEERKNNPYYLKWKRKY